MVAQNTAETDEQIIDLTELIEKGEVPASDPSEQTRAHAAAEAAAEKEELQSKRNNLFEEKMLEHNAQMQKFLLTHTETTRKELGEWGRAKEEERSFVRKDVSEIIKLMSIAVVGIVGFINLFKK